MPVSPVGASAPQQVAWLAYVGLEGAVAYVQGRGWHRWSAKGWRPTNPDAVRARVEAALETAHRRADAVLDDDLAAALMAPLKHELTVAAERVGLGGRS